MFQLKSLCKATSLKQQKEKELYDQGLEKIEKELDIRNVAQKLRTLNFIAQVLLTKSQRRMIPYFKEHLINYKNEKDAQLTKFDEKQFQTDFQDVLQNAMKGTKLDVRIVKNLDFYSQSQFYFKK